ncbi:MAG: hypothetical protein WD844_04635 [Thermoleophilaceae bacterium]
MKRLAIVALPIILLIAAVPASAAIFGTDPVPISVTAGGGAANGPSGGPAISGDDREGRYVAFHSEATNLIPGDTNDETDVFLYERPEGERGTSGLDDGPARPAGELKRISIGTGEQQGDGRSLDPEVSGSVQDGPRCVVFRSRATNLSEHDDDDDYDIYVRDLRYESTRLLSRGVRGHATNPTIDGDCRKVAFEAGRYVYTANARADGRKPRRFTRGHNPDYALDGNAIVWERGSRVYLRRAGRTTRVAGNGSDPAVSDSGSSRRWAVVFDTRSGITRGDRDRDWDVYMRVFDSKGQRGRTKLISAYSGSSRSLRGDSFNGGITPYAWDRGIVTFVRTSGRTSDVYYRNLNSDNIDDLAHATSDSSRRPAIKDLASSARANFIAFSSPAMTSQDVLFKHLIDGEEL